MARFQLLGSKVRLEIDGRFIGLYEDMDQAEMVSDAYSGRRWAR